jgi:hypothetical protein
VSGEGLERARGFHDASRKINRQKQVDILIPGERRLPEALGYATGFAS